MTNNLFYLNAVLTFDSVAKERERIKRFLATLNVANVCFSLKDVVQCDSAGLALLIEISRMCHQAKIDYKIEHIPSIVFALAEFCGVKTMLMQA